MTKLKQIFVQPILNNFDVLYFSPDMLKQGIRYILVNVKCQVKSSRPNYQNHAQFEWNWITTELEKVKDFSPSTWLEIKN